MRVLTHENVSYLEPTSVELNIDGTTDQCSRGEDVNFQFTGFGLIGTVRCIGLKWPTAISGWSQVANVNLTLAI